MLLLEHCPSNKCFDFERLYINLVALMLFVILLLYVYIFLFEILVPVCGTLNINIMINTLNKQILTLIYKLRCQDDFNCVTQITTIKLVECL